MRERMYALLRNVNEFELTAMVIVRSELGFTILEIEEEEFDDDWQKRQKQRHENQLQCESNWTS